MKNDSKDDSLYTLLTLVVAVPLAAWAGFVLSVVWAWFIVPLGVPAVGMWHAAGIKLTVGWLTQTISPDDRRSSGEKFTSVLVLGTLLPPIVLGLGALFHAFM